MDISRGSKLRRYAIPLFTFFGGIVIGAIFTFFVYGGNVGRLLMTGGAAVAENHMTVLAYFRLGEEEKAIAELERTIDPYILSMNQSSKSILAANADVIPHSLKVAKVYRMAYPSTGLYTDEVTTILDAIELDPDWTCPSPIARFAASVREAGAQ